LWIGASRQFSSIGDADQPVLGVPGVGALAVRGKVAHRVPGQRLARQDGELVEAVVGRGLGAGGRVDGGGVARFIDRGDEILGRAGEFEKWLAAPTRTLA